MELKNIIGESLKEQEEELRKHVENLPCFTCLIRPLCIEFFSNRDTVAVIKEKCNMFDQWVDKRDKNSTLHSGQRAKIMEEAISEILRKEKVEYAK